MSTITNKVLINKDILSENYNLDVSGNVNFDGSIFQNGIEFSGGASKTYVDNYNSIQDASIISLENLSINAWNGLTKTDNSIGLGGNVINTATMSNTYNGFNFGLRLYGGTTYRAILGDIYTGGSGQSYLDITSTTAKIGSGGGSLINITTNVITSIPSSGYISLSSGAVSLTLNGSSSSNGDGIITDSRGTKKGLIYANDYSSTFVNRSLVDKEYVDSVAGGSGPSRNLTSVDVSLNIDWGSKNDFVANNIVDVAIDSSVSFLNTSNAAFGIFKVNIYNSSHIRFPNNSVSGDPNWSSGVWDPSSNGQFTISIYKTTDPSDNYEINFTQLAAV